MRRFRAPLLPGEGATVGLAAEATHHLLRVVQIRRGERVVLFDGEGAEAEAVLEEAGLVQRGPTRRVTPAPPLALYLGIPKGEAMDRAVRMATECGVSRIVPLLTKRSVPKGDRSDRWARIAESAAQQCGRADLPEVCEPMTLPAALRALPPGEHRIALPGAPRLGPAEGPASVWIGPEGGFDDAEVRAALDVGLLPFGLGRFVLRSDTAAAVALALTAGG